MKGWTDPRYARALSPTMHPSKKFIAPYNIQTDVPLKHLIDAG
jgi:hypothetical protein